MLRSTLLAFGLNVVFSAHELRARNQFKSHLCPFLFAAIQSVFDSHFEPIDAKAARWFHGERIRRIECSQIFTPLLNKVSCEGHSQSCGGR